MYRVQRVSAPLYRQPYTVQTTVVGTEADGAERFEYTLYSHRDSPFLYKNKILSLKHKGGTASVNHGGGGLSHHGRGLTGLAT